MNASSPYKSEELTSALNSWSETDNPRSGGATELGAGYEDGSEAGAARVEELSTLVGAQRQQIAQLEARLAEQRGADPGQLVQLQLERSRLELRVRQLETAGREGGEGAERALRARCDLLVKERDAVQTIMEHKVGVLPA